MDQFRVFQHPANGALRIASKIVLFLAGGIEFFNFFIRLPAEKWRQDLDSQKAELTAGFMKTIESADIERANRCEYIEKLERIAKKGGWDGKTGLS